MEIGKSISIIPVVEIPSLIVILNVKLVILFTVFYIIATVPFKIVGIAVIVV
jgi:hypothetical protein